MEHYTIDYPKMILKADEPLPVPYSLTRITYYIGFDNIDHNPCKKWIENHFEGQFVTIEYRKCFNTGSKYPVSEEVKYFLDGDILIEFHSISFVDIAYYDKKDKSTAQNIATELCKFLVKH